MASRTPSWSSAMPPRTAAAAATQHAPMSLPSSLSASSTNNGNADKPRIQISLPPAVVSGRGRKKTTPAPRRPGYSASQLLPAATTITTNAATSATISTNATTTATTTNATTTATKKKSKKNKQSDWPTSSADALPPLSAALVERLQDKDLEFPINEECTSLTLSPSGRLLIACFSDGTLRLFDLTGTFHSRRVALDSRPNGPNNTNNNNLEEGWFDMDSSSSEEDDNHNNDDNSDGNASPSLGGHQLRSPTTAQLQLQSHTTTTAKTSGKRNRYVLSKENQRFGAVASQIHAKGVITSLLMDVDVAQDGQYCFAGVLRGSMELVAVHLGAVEAYLDAAASAAASATTTNQGGAPTTTSVVPDLLDLVTVFRRSDAKLRGFGACTRLRTASATKPPQYLLFTGKAIKNIHIWKFEPPLHANPKTSSDDDAKWVQLYDTQTNGNTITHLHFRHDSRGLLQGVSKSDDQKLRVWDLSYEQHHGNPKNPFFAKRSVIQKFAGDQETNPLTSRPKRPPFCDVTHSENTLGICGGFSICCGGSSAYNTMSIVSLDVPNLQTPYGHTELALPGGGATSMVRTSRRQQRGELKSVVAVAGMALDPSYVLLEVCDGSIIQYSHGEHGQPKVEVAALQSLESMPHQEGISRKMCVGKMGSVGVVTAAVATYNGSNGRGTIVLRPLNGEVLTPSGTREKGFWGFSPHFRLSKKQKKLRVLSESTNSGASASQSSFEAKTCGSPRLSTDISNWTHPPSSAISERTPSVLATPPSASVKLFGSERQDCAPFMSPRAKSSKKKKISLDSSATRTPAAAGPVLVPQSSIQAKSKLGGKASKQDEKDARQPKKLSSKSKPPRHPSLDDLVQATKFSSASKDGVKPSSTVTVTAKKVKVAVSKEGPGPSTLQIPGTPKIQPMDESLDGKSTTQATSANALGGVQKVSPDPKEVASTTVTVKSKASQMRNDQQGIAQFLDKGKQPATKGTKPSSNTSKSLHPEVASPPVPRKRSAETSKQSETREAAEAMCELGSAKKSKRSASDMNNPTSGNAKTPRGKRKPPAPQAKKNQLVGSQHFKDQCREQELHLELLKKKQIPETPVEARMGLSETDVVNQEVARMKLAAEHRAGHEMLLKRIIHAAQDTVKALRQAETLGAVDDAEEAFRDSFGSYYEMLDETLWRQTEEASNLADRQTLERQGSPTPTLQTSFPFYGVFDEVTACVDTIIRAAR